MRLWSLHPKYLDAKDIVALWREALLAQKVLSSETRGYRNHPPLQRFRSQGCPIAAISAYLHAVSDEAVGRGYRFDRGRILLSEAAVPPILVTKGQLQHELMHLSAKLRKRDPAAAEFLEGLAIPDPHPLFEVIPGPIAEWERPSKQSSNLDVPSSGSPQ